MKSFVWTGETSGSARAKLAQHLIEEVGAKLRDMMPWIKKRALVDKTKNQSFVEPLPGSAGRGRELGIHVRA